MAEIAEKREVELKNILKFVTFALGLERFGIPIEQVKEIIASYEIVPLPKTPEFIEGIISLRGDIIPVVEMRKRFDMPVRDDDEETRIIVLEMDDFSVGIQVDSVYEVLKLAEDAIEPPPRLVAGLKADYLEGVAEVNSKLTIILNLDEVFSSSEKIALKEGTRVDEKPQKEKKVKAKAEAKGEAQAESSACKVSSSGQVGIRGKSYYVGKKYKGEDVTLKEEGGMISVLLGDEKIKEFEA